MLQPESQGHRSYFEAFTRRRNLSPDFLSSDRLLTDRGAYLNFLEVQLEKVSSACLAAQNYGLRLESVAVQASAAEDKVLSTTKLVRLAQTYSEEQGREQAKVNNALEERLAHLERKVEGIVASALDATKIRAPSCDGYAERSGPSRYGVTLPLSGVLPCEPCINSPSLSRWIQHVDQRLGELQNLVSISQMTAANAAAGVPVEGILDTREADLLATNGNGSALTVTRVSAGSVRDAQEADLLATSANRSALTKTGIPVGSALDTPEAGPFATNSGRSAPPDLTASTGSRSADLKLVEERVRQLEEALSKANLVVLERTSTIEQHVQDLYEKFPAQCITNRSGSKSEPPAGGPGDTATDTTGGKIAPEGLGLPKNHSYRRRRSHSPRSSSAGGVNEGVNEHTNVDEGVSIGSATGLLIAIEKGRQEADRAREAAEEALRVGKEAAERSERTESLAKTMAVRSMKHAREQHDKVNDALDRMSAKLRNQRTTEVNCLQRNTTRMTQDGLDSAEPAIDNNPSASDTAIASGLGESAARELARDIGGDYSNETRIRRRGRQRRGGTDANEQEPEPDLIACHQEDADPCPRDTRDVIDARSGRRIALNVARTTLDSVFAKLSCGPDHIRACTDGAEKKRRGRHGTSRGLSGGSGRRGGGDRGGGKRVDASKADELRPAICGVVNTVSRRKSSCTTGERQQQCARCSQRSLGPGLRLVRSRDHATTSKYRDREKLAGYWVPPGNITCQTGETRHRTGSSRVVRDAREDRLEDEGDIQNL